MTASQKRARTYGEMIAKMQTISKPAEPNLKLVPDTLEEATAKAALPRKDQVMKLTPYGSPTETDAQAAKRLGLKKGEVVRWSDDENGTPVRKTIRSVDDNGLVTFEGSRKTYPARNFIPR